jgi:aspartyl-tRNA synthetase
MWALQRDWTEIMEFSERLLIYIFKSLQEDQKYKNLTEVVRRLHPEAGNFTLGLNADGKFFRVRLADAKHLLQEKLNMKVDVDGDLT